MNLKIENEINSYEFISFGFNKEIIQRVSLRGLARRRSCRQISTRSSSTGLWITQQSIRTAGCFSPSATEWKAGRRFKAGSGRAFGLCQMPSAAFSVRGKECTLLWKKSWILVKYDVRMLGAKNNDSTSEKWVIAIFCTWEYRKCGNSN